MGFSRLQIFLARSDGERVMVDGGKPAYTFEGEGVVAFYDRLASLTMRHYDEQGFRAPRRSMVPDVVPPANPGEDRVYADDGRIYAAALTYLGIEGLPPSLLVFIP